MVKDHSDSEREETRYCHMGYSFQSTAKVLLYAPSHRQDNTYHGVCYTSRGALAGTNSSMGPSHEASRFCLFKFLLQMGYGFSVSCVVLVLLFGFKGVKEERMIFLYQMEGRKEKFYLTMHSTCFIYGYMASYIR